MNNTFDERLQEGRVVENLIENYMRSFGFEVFNRKVDQNDIKSIFENLKFGDTIIRTKYNEILFDEKYGSFISEKSIKGFQGNYYIITPNGDISEEGIRNARVIKNSTIKSYFNKVSPSKYKTAKSGDKGYRFNYIKNYLTLEEFMIQLVKFELLDDNYSNKITWLKSLFNKVILEKKIYESKEMF